jgi:hypothetical protein
MKLILPLFVQFSMLFPLVAGGLPQLSDQPWIAQYSGYEQRKFRFSVSLKGEGLLLPSDGKDGFISDRFGVKFAPVIEETLPDGKVIGRLPVNDGWEAITPATVDPEKLTYQGTVAGGARFEVNLEFDGAQIRGGGRILEKGKSANPLRFVLRVQVPDVYIYQKKDPEKRADLMKKDRVELVRADGKKLKLDVAKPIDAESPEFSGPGITQARIEISAYKDLRLELAADAGSVFELWNKDAGALYQGFTLGWRHDPGKDPAGKTRFTLLMR